VAAWRSFEKDFEATSGLRWKDGQKRSIPAMEWEWGRDRMSGSFT